MPSVGIRASRPHLPRLQHSFLWINAAIPLTVRLPLLFETTPALILHAIGTWMG